MTSDRPPAFFVGEHMALDFLNTTATPRGALIEWLADGNDLVGWLEQDRTHRRPVFSDGDPSVATAENAHDLCDEHPPAHWCHGPIRLSRNGFAAKF